MIDARTFRTGRKTDADRADPRAIFIIADFNSKRDTDHTHGDEFNCYRITRKGAQK
jgi:hypothetical protein